MEYIFKLTLTLVLMSAVSSSTEADVGKSSNPEIHRQERWSDKMRHAVVQGKCRQVTERATRDCRWVAGMYPYVDHLIKRGRIVAFKLRWFNGHWSSWYVPGVNDLDRKINVRRRRCSLFTRPNSVRRMWSYFYDHTHTYILCTN